MSEVAAFDLLRPWALLLLPLPWLAWRLLPADRAVAGLVVPARVAGLLQAVASRAGGWRLRQSGLRFSAALAGWAALVLALAGPLTSGGPLPQASGRDLLLALDLSASMQAQDVELEGRRVERFAAVKALAGAFIRGREGDRVGLIVFGEETYLVAPLTYDVRAVEGFLDEVVIGLPGRKTAIGNAVGLAIKTLERQPEAARVLILLSDGDSNAGLIGPGAAARLAAAKQVRIHTIGFGRPLLRGFAANDGAGGASGLAEMAAMTGGRHFSARSTEALRQVYAELDQLEPTETEGSTLLAERGWSRELLLLALAMLVLLSWLDLRDGRV
jgi:Ca-activated chloride channel family protein